MAVTTVGQTGFVRRDQSAAKAMDRLSATTGTISGEQMRAAVWSGIGDHDSHGASSELVTVRSWAKANQDRLSPEAKAVVAAYEQVAADAKGKGLSSDQMATLRQQLAKAAQAPSGTPARHDAGVQKALRSLDAKQGPIDGQTLRTAILHGTQDHDGQAAGREFSDFQAWTNQHAGRLTPEAKQVMAVYARYANAARAQGDTGLPVNVRQRMAEQMQQAAGAPTPAPKPKPDGAPTHQQLFQSRKDWFVSQFRGHYNPHEDQPNENNSNCGPTSVVMVARAFGKVHGGLGKMDAEIERARKAAEGGTNETTPTRIEGLRQALKNQYHLKAALTHNPSLHDIEAELKKGHLVLTNVVPKYFSEKLTNGHFTVVTEIKNGKVYLNDPGTNQGPKVITVAQFERALRLRRQMGGQGMLSVSP